jgi:hypothetical protein
MRWCTTARIWFRSHRGAWAGSIFADGCGFISFELWNFQYLFQGLGWSWKPSHKWFSLPSLDLEGTNSAWSIQNERTDWWLAPIVFYENSQKKTAALTHRDDIGIRVTKPVIIFGSNIQAGLDEMCPCHLSAECITVWFEW